MKNVFKLFFTGAIMLSFAQCGSSQVFEKDPGFTLDTCHFEPWTVGEDDRYSGFNLYFPVSAENGVVLDSVYFGRKKAQLQRIQKGTYVVYKAVIDTTPEKRDIIMHADARQEVGNTPPPLNQNPFDLAQNAAVLSYLDNGVRKYYKVEEMEAAPPLRLEQRPVQKN